MDRPKLNLTKPLLTYEVLDRLVELPFTPMDWQREKVKELAAAMLKQDEIVQFIINPNTGRPISVPTLLKHFRRELDIGLMEANIEVAKRLKLEAVSGNVSALIWWEKTRRGFKETITNENVGKDGETLSPDQVVIILPHNNRDPIPAYLKRQDMLTITQKPDADEVSIPFAQKPPTQEDQ